MACKIIYKGISYNESDFKSQIERYVAINNLFNENKTLANTVYGALGFQGSISLESNLKNTGKTEKELTDYLKNKYPEIKLNISNNPIWEQSSDIVKNQEEYNKEVSNMTVKKYYQHTLIADIRQMYIR